MVFEKLKVLKENQEKNNKSRLLPKTLKCYFCPKKLRSHESRLRHCTRRHPWELQNKEEPSESQQFWVPEDWDEKEYTTEDISLIRRP